MKKRPLRTVLLLLFCAPAEVCEAQDKAHLQLDSPFAPYVEPDFPFFTQTVDARKFGPVPQPDNLTPRGIILPAGHGFFGCFDPDLLRWSVVWKATPEGEYLSMNGMGSGSYRQPLRKAAPGQGDLPHPFGTPLLTMPPQPGIAVGETPSVEDPRARGGAEAGELGLGPVPETLGRFSGIRLVDGGAQLEYRIAGIPVSERLVVAGEAPARLLEIGPHPTTLQLRTGPGKNDWLRLPPSTQTTNHQILFKPGGGTENAGGVEFPKSTPPPPRWKSGIKASSVASTSDQAPWVFDDLPLPTPNPWRRQIRPTDLEFFPDGRAAVLTFDGDVWIVENLGGTNAVWKRFASGLHEPQSLCLIGGVIHVFDRNGIVRLMDTDGNGEADWYENFCNTVAQSAETRNYPMDMVPAREGGVYLALGGQIGSTIGKHNGVVIKVAPDGRAFEVIATGLRQPYLGYDPSTGLLTATDQQGNWKPATPVYRVEQGRYFGFQPEKFGAKATHPAPVAPPEIWIPHFVNQSAASQVWVKQPDGAQPSMGALNGALVHIAYSRPGLFKIYLDPEGAQGAVMPLLTGFPSALLNGRVHPRDGLLYVTGFQISGFPSGGNRIGGVYRVRPGSKAAWLPREIRAEKRGILISFESPLSEALAREVGRYSADRWNYHRTHLYGSGNYRTDNDKPGQEVVPVSSAQLSKDGKSVFLGIRDMRPTDTLRLTYRLPVSDEDRVESVYLSLRTLPSFNLTALGFATDKVDLTERRELTADGAVVQPSADLGRQVAVKYGCISCHSTGDPSLPAPPLSPSSPKGSAGPPWSGLWNTPRTFSDGSKITAVDEAYIRESILDPARRVPAGYELERTGIGMPSFLGVLRDHEIDSIILFIRSLEPAKKP
jgi:hypothetical protein